MELETDNTVNPNGHSQSGSGTAKGTYPTQGMWYNAYEMTYGLTDRIETAAYLNMAMPSGHGYWWAGDKVRVRGRLFDEETLPSIWAGTSNSNGISPRNSMMLTLN